MRIAYVLCGTVEFTGDLDRSSFVGWWRMGSGSLSSFPSQAMTGSQKIFVPM